MIGLGIDMVDANGVGSQLRHEFNVASALLRVDERIIRNELIRDTCKGSVSVNLVKD
jgi:hypothetical protein